MKVSVSWAGDVHSLLPTRSTFPVAWSCLEIMLGEISEPHDRPLCSRTEHAVAMDRYGDFAPRVRFDVDMVTSPSTVVRPPLAHEDLAHSLAADGLHASPFAAL